MSEPIKTEPTENGRPAIAEQQYWDWLDLMRPFLRQGHSLWYAMDKCDLLAHKNRIYQKTRESEEFREKIDKLQATIAELNNSVIFKTIENLHARIIESDKTVATPQEVTILKLVAEKHRTSQPFYANRQETAEAKDDDFGRVVDVPVMQYIIPEGIENEQPTEPAETAEAGDTNNTDTEATPGLDDPNQ